MPANLPEVSVFLEPIAVFFRSGNLQLARPGSLTAPKTKVD